MVLSGPLTALSGPLRPSLVLSGPLWPSLVLCRSKTKLAASLARCRVKQNLVSVSCVLPDPVRTNQKRAKLLPFYAWVNPLTSR